MDFDCHFLSKFGNNKPKYEFELPKSSSKALAREGQGDKNFLC
jgi:hypothetical protein